jgi:hypothetical protein
VADNRRTSTRHAVSIDATITLDGAPSSVVMNNLSLGGAQLSSSTRYAMGQKLTLSFKITTLPDPVEVGATVRWSDGTNVGVQFDGLRARDVWGLNELFKQLAG